MDEAKLIEKLRLIEALFAGATTADERVAAGGARSRIERRLEVQERADPAVEFRFTLPDAWSRKVLLALVRRVASSFLSTERDVTCRLRPAAGCPPQREPATR